ncbi:MAG: S41 family peptidase [Rhodoferax sp.]|uniref:S41 family peptidase n=1 Tax=Rhodoferax sp. TaxID=50421 RepID=UPI002629D939|nr:S41 family peptidase [Rhodoferax sp.]MDD5335251.1 S41 family peptidase [Rhodoferax sp.]
MTKNWLLCGLAAWALAGCGGGGGNSSAGARAAYPASSVCTPTDEKTWVRAYLDDVYLWYLDIVDVNAASYATPVDYFAALLVKTKDRFSFAEAQTVVDAYFQSGQVIGYGATFVRASDGSLRVAYSEPNSPASLAGIDRGSWIVNINGRPEGQLGRAAFLAALYPVGIGDSNNFDVMDPGTGNTRNVTLTAALVNGTPVLKNQVYSLPSGKKVGYMVFNDQTANAEAPLSEAIAQFAATGIDDLVLDLRYNGGGYLYIASELGYMIGGAATRGQVFERLRYNDKHPEKTNNPASTVPFFDTDTGDKPLPTLGLKRVFVLTGPGTCSASESIINGLNPFLNVITIGGTSCGKPYGFNQKNNCGTAYFAIQFDGVNAVNQGAYINGFSPVCAAADDLAHQFGDSNERLLSTALAYQSAGACPAGTLAQAKSALHAPQGLREIYRAPWRENRILK